MREPTAGCSVIQLAPDCKARPLDVMVALEKEDIETRPVWKPMHMQPVFADCDYIDNGKVGENLFENGVCLAKRYQDDR